MAEAKCPGCGGKVHIGGKNYYCEHYVPNGDPEECNFILWKNDLERQGKVELSDTEAIKLLAGEAIPLKLKSKKSGKNYECKGKLAEIDWKEKKQWHVQLEFEDRQTRVLGGEDA